MLFIAFSLDDFHKESRGGGVRFRFVSARSLKQAKELVTRSQCGSWAVVSKRSFDKGIVLKTSDEESAS